MNASKAMLISGIATVVILVIGLTGAGYESTRLAAAEKRRMLLVVEAENSGISKTTIEKAGSGRVPARKHERQPDKRADELLDLLKTVNSGADNEKQANLVGLLGRLGNADGSTLRDFLAKVFDDPGLKTEESMFPVVHALLLYAEQAPEEGLVLFGKAADYFENHDEFQAVGEQVVAAGLGEWAKRDPLAAAAWLRDHEATHKKFISENARKVVLTAAATRDVRLAFGMLGTAEISDRNGMVHKIMKGVTDPGDRLEALSAMRGYLEGLGGNERKGAMESGMRGLAYGVSGSGFEASRDFLEKAALDQSELDLFATGLGGKEVENGLWLSWMGDHVSPGIMEKEVAHRVSFWMESDYEAAGQWLARLPAGNLRDVSVKAYAETAAKYDPETAAQWAETLPEGESREETIRKVYEKWPKEDAADAEAARAFAKRHGID